MPDLGELDDYLDPDLKLTVSGRRYVIKPPSAELYLRCRSLMNRTAAAMTGVEPHVRDRELLSDEEEGGLFSQLCGPTWQQMADDGVDPVRARHVGLTTFFWVGVGPEMATAYFRNAMGGQEAPGTPTPPPTTPSPTGEASKTPTPASTSGTSSPSI